MDTRIDKYDVLERPELPELTSDDVGHVRPEGLWGENFIWSGGLCYVPVIWRGQKYKKRIFLKSRIVDDL